jgi:uncharacterized membrane protein (DUF485 family)
MNTAASEPAHDQELREKLDRLAFLWALLFTFYGMLLGTFTTALNDWIIAHRPMGLILAIGNIGIVFILSLFLAQQVEDLTFPTPNDEQ